MSGNVNICVFGRGLLQSLPLDRVHTETDGPFVLVNKPPLPDTEGLLAALRCVSADLMAAQISTKLLSLAFGNRNRTW